MQKGIESISQFVVSRGDASELFEPIEETFDKVASLVTMPVDQTLCLPILARRNIGFCSVVFNGFDQFVLSAVTALVSIWATRAAPWVTSAT
jgi:hypothetical protein